MITKEQQERYLLNPNLCIYCQGKNINASGFEDNVEQVDCEDCGKTWYDCYKLVGVMET